METVAGAGRRFAGAHGGAGQQFSLRADRALAVLLLCGRIRRGIGFGVAF